MCCLCEAVTKALTYFCIILLLVVVFFVGGFGIRVAIHVVGHRNDDAWDHARSVYEQGLYKIDREFIIFGALSVFFVFLVILVLYLLCEGVSRLFGFVLCCRCLRPASGGAARRTRKKIVHTGRHRHHGRHDEYAAFAGGRGATSHWNRMNQSIHYGGGGGGDYKKDDSLQNPDFSYYRYYDYSD